MQLDEAKMNIVSRIYFEFLLIPALLTLSRYTNDILIARHLRWWISLTVSATVLHSTIIYCNCVIRIKDNYYAIIAQPASK